MLPEGGEIPATCIFVHNTPILPMLPEGGKYPLSLCTTLPYYQCYQKDGNTRFLCSTPRLHVPADKAKEASEHGHLCADTPVLWLDLCHSAQPLAVSSTFKNVIKKPRSLRDSTAHGSVFVAVYGRGTRHRRRHKQNLAPFFRFWGRAGKA